MDPIINCVIGACCDAATREQALTDYLVKNGVDATGATIAASLILETFDLVPAGCGVPLVKAIAQHARGEKYKG